MDKRGIPGDWESDEAVGFLWMAVWDPNFINVNRVFASVDSGFVRCEVDD